MQRIFLVVKVHDLVAVQRRDAGRPKHEIFKKINKKNVSPLEMQRDVFFQGAPLWGNSHI